MNDGSEFPDERKTDPDSLPAMAAALRRIEANSAKAADYAFRAYELASSAHRRNVAIPYALVFIAVCVSCAALAVSCGMVR